MVEWRGVVGWERFYSVSERGEVHGVPRERTKGGPIRPRLHEFGYPMVTLSAEGVREDRTVHSLVAEAFIGPCPPGQEARHRDGTPWHNWWDNLEYGTRSQNNLDRRGHRLDADGDEVCGEGHKFTPENTIWEKGNRRRCRKCRNASRRK